MTNDPVDLFTGLCSTRTIRRYRPESIPPEDLAKILFGATRAPSGSNRQPFRFVVLRDSPVARQAKALMGNAAQEMWAAKEASDGYGEGSGASDDSPKARMSRTMRHYVEHFHEAPVVVLGCVYKYRKTVESWGASLFPACQNLLLSARALGYGGALVMWQKGVEDELHELLGIPEDVDLGACITLGVPAGHHGPVRRRPLPELVFEDRWDNAPDWAIDPPGTRFSGAAPDRVRRPSTGPGADG